MACKEINMIKIYKTDREISAAIAVKEKFADFLLLRMNVRYIAVVYYNSISCSVAINY